MKATHALIHSNRIPPLIPVRITPIKRKGMLRDLSHPCRLKTKAKAVHVVKICSAPTTIEIAGISSKSTPTVK
jgi:hypothetical protein